MKKKIIAIISAIAAFALGAAGVTVAFASVSYFLTPVSTSGTYGSTATTTTNTLGINTGTTTLTADSFQAIGNTANYGGENYATDKSTLLINTISSSSAAVLKITLQYSQDGVNWYNNDLSTTTSAGSIEISIPVVYTISGNSVSSTTNTALSVATPTRYYRAVFTNSGASTTMWAQFVPERQMPTDQ